MMVIVIIPTLGLMSWQCVSDQLVEDEDKAHCAGIFGHTNWDQAKELEVCMGCGCVGVASCSSCYYNWLQEILPILYCSR